MNVKQAQAILTGAEGSEDPVFLSSSVLRELTIDDLPEGVAIEIGTEKDNVFHLEWEGRLYRDGDCVVAEAEYTNTRKYWYAPLGLEQYMDLLRRAVETRQRVHGDVQLGQYEDDGAYIHLHFTIPTAERNLGRAFELAKKIANELEEASNRAADEVGQRVAEVAARLSGWGSNNLDQLVDNVEKAKSTDDKGRSLEELSSRLFETVQGLTVTGRIRTATEEIDISILNDSNDPRLRRESALLLAECKNWSGKCGKDEFVLFQQKVENRNRRCSVGFLVSWNGFAVTVTKEMLRGSREDMLIVPITGEDIRHAVRTGSFTTVLLEAWERAVNL
jgi:hypothetical protein